MGYTEPSCYIHTLVLIMIRVVRGDVDLIVQDQSRKVTLT